jgi:hypothetical protein
LGSEDDAPDALERELENMERQLRVESEEIDN